jgi:hypothetical protein
VDIERAVKRRLIATGCQLQHRQRGRRDGGSQTGAAVERAVANPGRSRARFLLASAPGQHGQLRQARCLGRTGSGDRADLARLGQACLGGPQPPRQHLRPRQETQRHRQRAEVAPIPLRPHPAAGQGGLCGIVQQIIGGQARHGEQPVPGLIRHGRLVQQRGEGRA